ncbi:ArsR/SmtB family transcription factor [Streptomyces laurentii]|uniref:ArsR/SmtB family transcription factor n=1 Tax=Streptomyces laurentii TaxID=39478 RepID=UPI0036840624
MASADDLNDAAGDSLDEAALAFGLLASPVRLRILRVLTRGESSVASIADEVGGALSTISQHLSVLKRSGLVGSRRDGRRQMYFVKDRAAVSAVSVMIGALTARTKAWPARARGPIQDDY